MSKNFKEPPDIQAVRVPPPDFDTVELARRLYGESVTVNEILKQTGLTLRQLYRCLDGVPSGTRPSDQGLPPIARRRHSRVRREPASRREALGGINRVSLINRLWRTAERQAAEIEERLGTVDSAAADREKDAKTLSVLARTVRELIAIDTAHSSAATEQDETDDDSLPRDIDELRLALAERIERLRAERLARVSGNADAG